MSLWQGQRSNQVAHLHPQPMSLPSINFLHLMVSEIHARQTSSHRPPAHPDTIGEINTLTALKGCGVKNEKVAVTHLAIVLAIPYND